MYPTAIIFSRHSFLLSAPHRDAPEPYFWLDVICINQHATAELDARFWETSFRDMIATIGHTVLVLSPWERPVAATRVWCLWEIYSTVTTNRPLTITMTPDEEAHFDTALRSDVERAIAQMTRIDVALAEATDPADRERIRAAIARSCGFDVLNVVHQLEGLHRGIAAASRSTGLFAIRSIKARHERSRCRTLEKSIKAAPI